MVLASLLHQLGLVLFSFLLFSCTLADVALLPPPKNIPDIWRAALKVSEVNTAYLQRNMCRTPLPGKCLFYTSKLSKTAQQFVLQQVGSQEFQRKAPVSQTIWNMWPEKFYQESQEEWNEFRDIMTVRPDEDYDASVQRAYFARMSTVLARNCHKEAWVMTTDVNNIPHNGIWEQFERPTLMSDQWGPNKRVDIIRIMDEKGNNQRIFWIRGRGFQGHYANGKRLGPNSDRNEELAHELQINSLDAPSNKPSGSGSDNKVRVQVNETVALWERAEGDCVCGLW